MNPGLRRRYTITKRFDFSASHQLRGLPPEHQCSRLHGHNYAVELELGADELDHRGFVVDYGDLSVFKTYLDDKLDHRHLNDCMAANPTAEHLADMLHGVATVMLGSAVLAVRVHETPKTCAEYRP